MANLKLLTFKSFITFLFFFWLVAASNLALAEKERTGLYGGFIFSESNDTFKPDVGDKSSESRGHLKMKLGKSFNDYFSIEGQLGMTSNSDDNRGILSYGAYLRASQNFSQYKLYGLLGFSGISAYDDDFEDVNESGLSYGVGMEIFGSKDIAITFELMQLLDESVESSNPDFGSGDLSFNTIGIGFTYYFSEETSPFIKNSDEIGSIRY